MNVRARSSTLLLLVALGGCRVTCGPDPHTPPGPMPSFDEDDANAHERAQWERGFQQTTQGQPRPAPVHVDPVAVGGAAAAVGAGIGAAAAMGARSDGGLPDARPRDVP